MSHVPLSVLILARDEEINLPDCLASVGWCDDVVVLDSFSADRTEEIARGGGARFHQRAFDDFASQRNHALDEIEFRHEWVFHLDADERFTPELLDECAAVIAENSRSGYLVPSKLMLRGRWLKHAGQYPVYQMRLMKVGEVRFQQVGHGQREGESTRGIGTLKSPYEHHSFSKGLEEWRERHERYAAEEARESLRALRTGSMGVGGLFSRDAVRRRRALKRLSMRLPARPLLKFLYMYVLRLGILDGKPGLEYCRIQAWYERLICRKTAGLRREERTRNKEGGVS